MPFFVKGKRRKQCAKASWRYFSTVLNISILYRAKGAQNPCGQGVGLYKWPNSIEA